MINFIQNNKNKGKISKSGLIFLYVISFIVDYILRGQHGHILTKI